MHMHFRTNMNDLNNNCIMLTSDILYNRLLQKSIDCKKCGSIKIILIISNYL